MEGDSGNLIAALTAIDTGQVVTIILAFAGILFLLFCSAIISGSENAFFSLSAVEVEEYAESEEDGLENINFLLSRPRKLLATILVSLNFIHLSIVMISSFIITRLFEFSPSFPVLVIQFLVVSFMIVFIGEILPKIYAVQNNHSVVKIMAGPIIFLSKVFYPVVYLLEKSTAILDKRMIRKGHAMSSDELNHAIDITSDESSTEGEKTILKGIANFGNITVKQIMRARVDVAAVDKEINFKQLLKKINEWGYSRMPVYDESFDKVIGILYIKDLVPHLKEDENFDWVKLIKPAYFIPETKKIDDLLEEFQNKRVHLAIVVDEYGGTAGIVTMEDIMEEIFGEINDEFDDDDLYYSRLDKNTFIFEAKIMLHDICRLMELPMDTFNESKGEADTLGGLILELTGRIPKLGQKIVHEKFTFYVESVDKRKIKRVKVVLNETRSEH